MFEHLGKFRTIVVTGPHRSGTSIAARIIAHDTGFRLVTESEFGHKNIELFLGFLTDKTVIHAPALFHIVPMLEVKTIFVYRPLVEILESQERCFRRDGSRIPFEREEDWQREHLEAFGAFDCCTAKRKHQLAEQWGLDRINYHDLSSHSLWVSEEKRRSEGENWHVERTS